MAGSPRKRERREPDAPVKPWRDDSSLSTREAFKEGNVMSVKHGAVSGRFLEPVAARLEAELLAVAPWAARPAFQWAVRAWSVAEATCELYRAWFAEVGVRDEEGQPLPGLVLWDRAEARASKLRARLSLDPAALASLINKLSAASAAGVHARAEIVALEREVSELDEQIAAALERKELES